MMILTPFQPERTSKSRTVLAGWSAHMKYLCSIAILRKSNEGRLDSSVEPSATAELAESRRQGKGANFKRLQ